MASTAESSFVARVRAEMGRQNLSIRGLARKIDPANVDRARRNIHRWLDEGIVPHRSSRREVAVALGLDEHSLDDDDEEADLAVVLLKSLRALVREEMKVHA